MTTTSPKPKSRPSQVTLHRVWWTLFNCAFFILTSRVPNVSGQRAIVSLGQRLQQQFRKKTTSVSQPQSQAQSQTFQGEKQRITSAWSDWTRNWMNTGNSMKVPTNGAGFVADQSSFLFLWVVTLILATGLLFVWPRRGSKHRRLDHGSIITILHTEDENFVVQNDRIVARKGMQQVDLAFEGIQLVLQNQKKSTSQSQSREILDGSIRGRARPGRMLAIMGPSGAGKSTVLHAIAGRIKDSRKLSLFGTRYLNGVPLSDDSQVPAAFIGQDVTFFPHMTVRETLSFRVELKLGSSLLSKQGRENMVEELLDKMGLQASRDTIVGDSAVRGISGGERKRLSIAAEMIGSPSTILLDEPTSGLDSTAATALVQTLRELADAGNTVIAVIHQPNQHVFAKFDDVLLVSEGKQMYFGPRSEVRSYMEVQGYPAPEEMGTAEHILDCISRAPIDDETNKLADERMERLATLARNSKIDLGTIAHNNGSSYGSNDRELAQHRFTARSLGGGPRANLWVQFRLLLKRSLREISRAKVTLILKLVQQISTALIYGGIYSLGTNQASIQDRFGLLSLIAIGSMNMGLAQTIRSFPREKAIVSNEIATNMYRTLPYFIGKAISELPVIGFFNGLFGIVVYKLTGLNAFPGKMWNFLGLLTMHGVVSQAAGLFIGAISPNSDVALAMFPALVVLNIIFDGKNIAEESIPRLLRWIPKVGLIRWGFEGLCVNEFTGLTFDDTVKGGGRYRGPLAKTGLDALARFGLGKRSIPEVVQAQLYIASACWLLSYLGLTLTRQRFLVMNPPPALNQ